MIEDESSDDDTVEIIKVKPPKEQKKRPIIGRIESPIGIYHSLFISPVLCLSAQHCQTLG